MDKTLRKIIPVLLLCLLFSSLAFAQTKDYGSYDPALGQAIKSLGKKYALVIGIDKYRHEPLPYAVRDAKEIGRLLKNRFGFRVEYLITPQKTTKSAIEDALDRLQDKSSANDQVVLFFSGHGKLYKRRGRVVGGFFIPSDGRRNRHRTLIPMDDILTFSKYLEARHALFIIDTCYSGIVGGMLGKSGLAEQTAEFVKTKMAERGRQIMTAGKSGQKAWMLDDFQMSLYSYYLRKGLAGEADSNGDHVITMSEIQVFLETRVPAKARKRQEPQWRHLEDTGSGEFVFIPKDFENWAKKQKGEPRKVVRVGPGADKPGKPVIREIPSEKKRLKGSGGLYIAARPEGVEASIASPDGTLYEGSCPITLSDLPAGKYTVELSKPLYHVERFPIDIGAGIFKKAYTLRPNYGWLSVKSKPSGASVYIDSKFDSKTPVESRVLKSGSYGIRIELPPWYHAYRSEIIISDEKVRDVDVELKPAFGRLFVNTEPEEAEVWIDKQKVGKTPYREEQISGDYLLSVRKELHIPVLDQRITIRDGEILNKTYKLPPNFGTVHVASEPSDAGIYIDGKKKGETPDKIRLDPGEHEIQVDRDPNKWVPKQYSIKIVRGSEVRINANLERKTGGINVYAKPDAGNVEVYIEGYKQALGTAPLTIKNLGTGKYTVICRAKRGSRKLIGKAAIRVEWGKIKTVRIELEKEGPKYRMRSEPKRVKHDHFKQEFNLDLDQRPLEYIENNYVNNGDGTITDWATGLMWQQSGSDKSINYNAAVRYIARLNGARYLWLNPAKFAGYSDWRLPTIPELISLLEREKQKNGIYISTLFDKSKRRCWSADKRSSIDAWDVLFSDGHVGLKDLVNLNYVRAVRSGQ